MKQTIIAILMVLSAALSFAGDSMPYLGDLSTSTVTAKPDPLSGILTPYADKDSIDISTTIEPTPLPMVGNYLIIDDDDAELTPESTPLEIEQCSGDAIIYTGFDNIGVPTMISCHTWLMQGKEPERDMCAERFAEYLEMVKYGAEGFQCDKDSSSYAYPSGAMDRMKADKMEKRIKQLEEKLRKVGEAVK